MSRSTKNPWLSRFAAFTSLSTLFLISLGGLVTSHGVGMAVPDWPTTFGHNMFLFPPRLWVGGVFYEHTHRLAASAVGFLTTILAVWLWCKESRRYLRWLGVAAFVGVVFQGILGGLRVALFKDEIGVFHAIIAQLFLVLVSSIALLTSRWWVEFGDRFASAARSLGQNFARARNWVAAATLLILAQLTLGATMRHQHAGLAVPDFPLAYGKIWPPLDEASIDSFNRNRLEHRFYHPITAFQIGLHMAHRITAVAVFLAVAGAAWGLRRRPVVGKLSRAWMALIFGQICLGALTVWSNKAADVTTLHVVAGAMSLVLGAFIWMIARQMSRISIESASHEPKPSDHPETSRPLQRTDQVLSRT